MLQRRRRKSNPPSPTSPTFTRRFGNSGGQDGYLNVSSPAEVFSATSIGSDSPSLDVTVPSPTFDLSPFPPSSTGQDQSTATSGRTGRLSDEYSYGRKNHYVEVARPSTSAASGASARPYRFPAPGSNVASPASGSSPRPPSFEHFPQDGFHHDYRQRPNDYAFSTSRGFYGPTSNYDRQYFDDASSTKNLPQKKSRLNLLIPKNLLARRRASSSGKEEDLSLKINTTGVAPLPEGDVSIRGNRVVDFNAPRPRRMVSHDASSGESSPLTDGRPSLQHQRRSSDQPRMANSPIYRHIPSPKHSPRYTEHFDESRPNLQPAQTAYLQSLVKATNIRGDSLAANQPVFAKRLPIRIPEHDEIGDFARGGFAPPRARQTSNSDSANIPAPERTPPLPPSKEPVSPNLDLPPPTTMPKHMTSTSSRFSFQLGTQDSSAQEKLLEAKHKEKQGSQKPERGDEADEDDFDDYDFDDDDGLEEKIPGVNADAEEDGFEPLEPANRRISTPLNGPTTQYASVGHMDQTRSDGLDDFHFTPESAVFNPIGVNSTSQPTPIDDRGYRIGIAGSKDFPGLLPPFDTAVLTESNTDGLGIGGIVGTVPPEPTSVLSNHTSSKPEEERYGFDDMYFDDGGFDESFAGDDQDFDETMLDDESGRIRDIPAENAKKFEALQQASKLQSAASWQGSVKWSESPQPLTEPGTATADSGDTDIGDDKQPPASLTEGNLAAYHNALVSAANEAAANGRFDRKVSHSRESEGWGSQSLREESQPGLVSDESALSRARGGLGIEDEDGFLLNDDYAEDDLMIAEANAEALENDDDGFYGQEFGFYARAPGKGGSDFANGGYFGPRGSNGVKRSHSAKANFQEPSLTPITERSEWSTRNSVSSNYVPAIPGSAVSMSSPGLAQLRESDNLNLDEEMSLGALMKLRRGAFGGSSNSINSLPGNYAAASPLGHGPHQAALSALDPGHRMTSSIQSLTGSAGIPESEEEDEEDEQEEEETVGLPTLTQSSPSKKPSDHYPPTPRESTAISPTFGSGKVGHSRTSSGAESVSYIRDPEGSDRWLLERRRTGDDGEMELIRREYLAGARI